MLDEPTENLDAEQVNRLVGVIRDYAQGANRRTCIIISHDMNFVFELADRVQVLRLGRVAGVREVASTTKDEVIAMITGSLADERSTDDPK